ncbi:DUF1963 domain-containing protein [Clostridium gasigenes]|uniref:DUF1963 domain-containing protein n=1 Tax=Clostridium gasigenes TaxID=94869 RepID=UPI001C0E1C41|nr:DUF1963 domain-containing protein [Clostridium gasigenes]MBU3089813.1 DUF1963 domain-containing protein [Clostridium gasigenes]
MMINEIQTILKRKATIFNTGGKRPTYDIGESWIGSIVWRSEGEEIPLDNNNVEMNPLATIFIKSKEYSPSDLDDIYLITIFMSDSFYRENIDFDNVYKYFVIRSYSKTEDIISCQWNNKHSKPFPLVDKYVDDDYPGWDNGGIPPDIFEKICEMENSDSVDYFEDIVEEMYSQHKVGGYPCFCQSGYWFGDGYEYVIQISSDDKAKFNIVHSGSFYFYYNKQKNDWKVHCDFY